MKGDALQKQIQHVLSVVFKEIDKETEAFNPDKYIKVIMGNILVGVFFAGTYKHDDPEVSKLLEITDRINDKIG